MRNLLTLILILVVSLPLIAQDRKGINETYHEGILKWVYETGKREVIISVLVPDNNEETNDYMRFKVVGKRNITKVLNIPLDSWIRIEGKLVWHRYNGIGGKKTYPVRIIKARSIEVVS